jgi:hypothetical protein
VLAFVNADVLASPMTRTVLMMASFAKGSRFSLRWSLSAEAEADAALRPGQTRLSAFVTIGPDSGDHVAVNNRIDGLSRGLERFVRCVEDGKVYYTNDHYFTFTEVVP